MFSIQVIILTYKNRFHLLEQVIKSLSGNEEIKDVLIVDNGCDYNLKDMLAASFQELKFNIDTLIINEPAGTTKGLSMAFEKINQKNTHVLILDDDNLLQGNIKEAKSMISDNIILNFLREGREPYTSFFKSGKNLKLVNNSFMGFSIISYLRFQSQSINSNKSSIESDYLPYGGTLIPLKVFSKLNINKDFILYHDDIDFFYRCKLNDYKLFITNKCKIIDIDISWHDKKLDLLASIKLNPENTYYAIRNKVYFEKSVKKNDIVFFMNTIAWRTVYFFKFFKRRKTQEYKILTKALNDGLKKKLGQYEK